MTCRRLAALADTTVQDPNAGGIGRGGRVAIVPPNGPEMATAFLAAAFLAIGFGATTAPLNPACREEEFEFILSGLNAKALPVEAGSTSPARLAAAKQGLAVLEIGTAAGAAADNFRFAPEAPADAAPAQNGGPAGPDDCALVLHTAGTISRPKFVPLSPTNVTASAQNNSSTLSLITDDTLLNIMPLFHIHVLIDAVPSSVSAGAGICCSPGFDGLRFFAWMEAPDPSWYTAVPTMHQTILS